MKKIKKADIVIIAVLLAVIVFIAFMVIQGGKTESGQGGNDITPAASDETPKALTINDYSGRKIGVQTGTIFDEMISENIPDAQISYYNSYTDLLSALKAGIIDGFAADEPMIKYMMTEDSSVDYIKDYMDDYSFGFAFSKDSKGEELCNEFSGYIKKIRSDGTLDEIDSIWFGSDESKKVIPSADTLPGEKGKLSLALESANAPFVFIQNNEIVGYEVDIAYRFCKEYGYGLELVDMNFDGIIPAVSSGKCSFGCSTITITEERRESVNFSEPHYDGGSVLAVRSSDMTGAAALSAENAEPPYTEYNGKRIGIKTGSSFEPITLEKFPDS
ncbi:MAG: transporter substrate-binding domain-containing protein, partial [Oscillospiraceae bacterium]|nr:transporter substrate-binding domain-containing protein [Oscillospiraceae bacterium]